MTPAMTVAGVRSKLTRDEAIQELRDYAQLYGPDFTSAAFNTSLAKWRDQPELRERYLLGNVLRGRPWYSLNTIKKAFPAEPGRGSWNLAREAAGLEANRPGPSKGGKRAAGTVAPIRGVDDRVRVRTVVRERVVTRDLPTDAPTNVPTRELRAAERRAERAEHSLAKVSERLSAARERARVHVAAAAKQRDRAERNAETVAALRDELREVGATLGKAVDRAERAEAGLRAREDANAPLVARITELELELSQTREELGDVRVELGVAREGLELADPERMEAARREVAEARERVADMRAKRDAAGRAAQLARRAQARAEDERSEAVREAASERRQRVAIQEASVGHDRPLSPGELDVLRARGPAGPAVFTAAVKEVARAANKGQRDPLRQALRAAAAAAVRWADRL